MRLERVLAISLAIKFFGFVRHRNVFHNAEQNDGQKGKFGDSHIN